MLDILKEYIPPGAVTYVRYNVDTCHIQLEA